MSIIIFQRTEGCNTYRGWTTGGGRSTGAGSGIRCGKQDPQDLCASSVVRPSCTLPSLRPGSTPHWALREERTLLGSHIPVPGPATGPWPSPPPEGRSLPIYQLHVNSFAQILGFLSLRHLIVAKNNQATKVFNLSTKKF